jgi:hypothetical protein
MLNYSKSAEDPSCPEYVRRAKWLNKSLKEEPEMETSDDDDRSDDEDS